MILANTLRRPLCAMPIMTSFTPLEAPVVMIASRPAIMDSPPSKENLF